jgi:predicted AAA+ superfamily ATPase
LNPVSAFFVGVQPGTTGHDDPLRISNDRFDSLFRFGGFPEPFIKASSTFHNKWQKTRNDVLLHQDLRGLTKVQELTQIGLLSRLIGERAGSAVNYSDLAKSVRVSMDTARRWIDVLSSLYFCFTLRPWFRDVSKSLLKEPKIFLWGWSSLTDPGARAENFIASHLLKYVQWTEDLGLNRMGLHFIRDKMKREVDFLVSKDGKPFILIEVKTSKETLGRNLIHFSERLQVPHTFQVVINMPYIESDCFKENRPVIVPAKTFLSQLS